MWWVHKTGYQQGYTMNVQFDFIKDGNVFNITLLYVSNPKVLWTNMKVVGALLEDVLFAGQNILLEDPDNITEHLRSLVDSNDVGYHIDVYGRDKLIDNRNTSFVYDVRVGDAGDWEWVQVMASIPTSEYNRIIAEGKTKQF